MQFTFTKKQAKNVARALERQLRKHGVADNIPLGKAYEILAGLQGFADSNALSAAVSREGIDRTLMECEIKHIQASADNRYGNEVQIQTHTGFSIAYDASAACDYVRVLDPYGREVATWVADEWKEDEQLVMGAILGALAQGKPLQVSYETKKETSPDKVQLEQPIMLYVLVSAADMFDEYPNYARVKLDQKLLDQVIEQRDLVKAHRLRSVDQWDTPDRWDGDAYLEMETMEVDDSCFRYKALIKHTDNGWVETADIEIDYLLKEIRNPGSTGLWVQKEGFGWLLASYPENLSSLEDFVEADEKSSETHSE